VKVIVLGAGAVGCYLGGRLALAGHKVTLVGRAPLVEATRGVGLLLHEDQVRSVPAAVTSSWEEAIDVSGPPDVVFATVKAFDVPAVGELVAAAGGDFPVVAWQNGVGSEERLAGVLGSGRVVSATLTASVSMPQAGIVQVYTPGRGVAVAPMVDEHGGQTVGAALAGELGEMLRSAGLKVFFAPDHRSLKWSKLCLNIMLNASCAILDRTPAEVAADPLVFDLERAAFGEATAVMTRLGARPVRLPGYSLPVVRALFLRAPAWVGRTAMAHLGGGGRGGKLPSLLGDLRRGRRRTEIDYLNGAVAEWGKRLGVETPVNRVLASLVAGLAAGTIDPADFRGNPRALWRFVAQTSLGMTTA